jgi:transcriptional regulator with XRE-family HTH domain
MFVDHRRELADFLRGRRARLAPSSPGRRRRTPGLRREEIAALAGLSVDWYTRLEQGRDVNPSSETLDALARVFGLDQHEREHLYSLARATAARAPTKLLDDSMRGALESMPNPALVLNPRFDVLGKNDAADRLFGGACGCSVGFNMLRATFLDPIVRGHYVDIEAIERDTVAGFRHSSAPYVGDPGFDELVRDLIAVSPRFAELWAHHDVRPKVGGQKRVRSSHGEILLSWHTLLSPEGSGQKLIFYSGANPEDRDRLERVLAGM